MAKAVISILMLLGFALLTHANFSPHQCSGSNCKLNEASRLAVDFTLCGDNIYYMWSAVCDSTRRRRGEYS